MSQAAKPSAKLNLLKDQKPGPDPTGFGQQNERKKELRLSQLIFLSLQ